MKKTILGCLILATFCLAAFAQDSREQAEARLRQAFQGENVALKIDMPATVKGVDILADRQNSTDSEKNQKRSKSYGTAIKSGDTVRVTGIRVTKNEITFELGGGGAREDDPAAAAGARPDPAPASSLESRARMSVNAAGNSTVTDNENDHSTLRYQTAVRKRDDALAAAEYETRRREAIERARTTRLKMGSRFVIKFDARDTASVTADELKRILADYVVF
jgi:hypothetical protein